MYSTVTCPRLEAILQPSCSLPHWNNPQVLIVTCCGDKLQFNGAVSGCEAGVESSRVKPSPTVPQSDPGRGVPCITLNKSTTGVFSLKGPLNRMLNHNSRFSRALDLSLYILNEEQESLEIAASAMWGARSFHPTFVCPSQVYG